MVNFAMKRSVPKEIPSEVEVSVVKMIVITRDDCISKKTFRNAKSLQSETDITQFKIHQMVSKMFCVILYMKYSFKKMAQ